jgi:hypothetical protein
MELMAPDTMQRELGMALQPGLGMATPLELDTAQLGIKEACLARLRTQ